MGYTHYFTKKKKVSKKEWNMFTEVCQKLYNNLPKKTNIAGGYYSDQPLLIGDGLGENEPEINQDCVCFNGKTPQTTNVNLSHETFIIKFSDPVKSSGFCKTERKPYDLFVVACLIAAHEILGYDFSSDGVLDREFKNGKWVDFDQDNPERYENVKEGFEFYSKHIKPVEPVSFFYVFV